MPNGSTITFCAWDLAALTTENDTDVVDVILTSEHNRCVSDPPGLIVSVTVRADDAADDEETTMLRQYLHSMLMDHDFDVSSPAAEAKPPAGAKVGDPASLNSLVVALAASGGVLTTLIGALQAWLMRSSARQIVVEIDGDRIEVSGASTEERRELTTAWINRHQPTAARPADGR